MTKTSLFLAVAAAVAAVANGLRAATPARVVPLEKPIKSGAGMKPVVFMHGIGDSGKSSDMESLVKSVQAAYPGVYVTSVAVADGLLSYITPMPDQVAWFASVVASDPQLADGFNAVGLSQGGLIVRGYIEMYNNPPVHNFLSLCGVLNGEYDCPLEIDILPFVCSLFKENPYRFLFNSTALSFSDYWVTYDNQSWYLAENVFLPYLNNEIIHANSTIYRDRVLSLNSALLVGATADTVIYPWQSEQFGGYVWNSNATVYTFLQSQQYMNDLIGLRTLYESSRLSFSQFDGDHLDWNQTYWDTVILPYIGS